MSKLSCLRGWRNRLWGTRHPASVRPRSGLECSQPRGAACLVQHLGKDKEIEAKTHISGTPCPVTWQAFCPEKPVQDVSLCISLHLCWLLSCCYCQVGLKLPDLSVFIAISAVSVLEPDLTLNSSWGFDLAFNITGWLGENLEVWFISGSLYSWIIPLINTPFLKS